MITNARTDTRTRKMAAGMQACLLPAFIVFLAVTLARPAAAQEWNAGQWAIDLSSSILNTELINSALRLGTKPNSAKSPTRPPVSKFDSGYRPDPAVTQRVIKEYLSFVKSVANEEAMRDLQEQLKRHNFVTAWRDSVRSVGAPASDDMADALASYLLLNWTMANNRMRDDDNPAAYLAVRDQIRNSMASAPSFAKLSEADRQGFAETMMINFVVQQSVITHAVQSNDKDLERRLGDAAQQRFQKEFNMNLRNLDLTSNGFVARQ